MSENPKCLVIGTDGLIGKALFDSLSKSGHHCLGTSRRASEVSDKILHLDLAGDAGHWPIPEVDVVVFCAAIARLQSCFSDPEGSRLVNVTTTGNLAKRFHQAGAHVVFLSTNQVFDGKVPFRQEHDAVCPLTVYGGQKAEAETIFKNLGKRWTILRLTKVFGYKPDLLLKWSHSLKSGEGIDAFEDMTLAPVLLGDVVNGIVKILHKKPDGILQFSGTEDLSYYQLACKLAVLMNKPESLVRRSSSLNSGLLSELQPQYTSLSTASAYKILNWVAKTPDEVLDILIQEL